MIHARLKPNFDFGLMTNDELLGIVETGESCAALDKARSLKSGE